MNKKNLADRIRKWYESYETAPPWSSVVGLVVRERKQERERVIEEIAKIEIPKDCDAEIYLLRYREKVIQAIKDNK